MRRALGLIAALAAAPAFAQSPSAFLPVDPDARAVPGVVPPEDAAPAPLQPEAAAGPSFVLRGVTLTGNEALPAEALAPLWADLIGTPVTLPQLDTLAATIAAAYRARGFVLSQAVLPQQTISDGIVTIQVIEGFVDRLAIAGGAQNQRDAAAILFAPVPADRPLRLGTLERGVLLGRDIFGGGVDTVVEPSQATFGAADLTVALTQAPASGFASADNRGSRLYGPVGFAVGGVAYNRLGLNEELGFVGAGAADASLGFVQVTAALPLLRLGGTPLDGAMLELEADYADGDPDLSESGAPAGQTLTTEEVNLRAALRVPFIRSRAQNLFGTIALNWQDADSVTGFGGAELTETDRLLVLDLGATWDRADGFGGVTLIEAGLRQGLDTSNTFVGGEITSGKPDFTLARLDFARLQRLGATDWSLWVEASGQYAFDILPNSERFGLGDATVGRGFAPGNTTGDSGYGLRLEVRRQLAGERLGPLGEAAEIYAFGDYGEAYDRDGTRDGVRWEPLGSAGIGMRLDVRDWLTVTPEITRQLDGRATDTTDRDKETRLYLGVVGRF